jgi:hypothetical protein
MVRSPGRHAHPITPARKLRDTLADPTAYPRRLDQRLGASRLAEDANRARAPSFDTERAADPTLPAPSRLYFRLIRVRSRASASCREAVPAQVTDGAVGCQNSVASVDLVF